MPPVNEPCFSYAQLRPQSILLIDVIALTVPIVLESAAMPMMPLLLLVLVLVAIGVLVLRTSRRSFVDDLAPGEIVFISLSIGLYFASWLLITLAEIGRLRLGWVLGLTIIFCAMVIIVTLIRQKPFGASPFFAATSRSWLTLLPFAIAIAILPFYRPFEYILGGRDPGVYVNAGIMMSKTGGVPFRDPFIDTLPQDIRGFFLGVYSSHGIMTTERLQGFWYASSPIEKLVPQGMHLFPAWLAVAKWLFGYPGLLWITPFFGLIGMLGVYHFTLRFGGTPAAIIATALFILSPIQIYFSRYPSSEILMLAFLWSSLYFFQLFQARSSRLCAALSGAGLGLALLAHIDSLLLLAPVCLLVAYYLLALPGERNVRYFGGAFLLFLIQTAGHLWFIARPYVLSIINALKIVPFLAEIALPGFFILLLLLYLFRHRIRQLLSDGAFNRLLSAAWPFLVGVAAWFAYFYRPTHPQGSWDLGNANSFLYFAYYLGGVATVVFVSALMYFGYGQKSRNILLTLMIATFFGFYFYRLQIYPELIWAMRRFLPVIWPASFILIGLFLWRLWQIGEGVRRVASRSLACCALALIGWHSTTTSRTYFKLNEFQGAVQGVDRCAKRFNKNDLLIFEPRFNGSLQTLSLPLWSVYGDNVLQMVFDNISQARIDSFFDHCHALFVSGVEIYCEHPCSAAEEENGDKYFAVHNTSASDLRKLTFDGGFSNFDQSFGPRVSTTGHRFEVLRNNRCTPIFVTLTPDIGSNEVCGIYE